jgi:hypothetical protein
LTVGEFGSVYSLAMFVYLLVLLFIVVDMYVYVYTCYVLLFVCVRLCETCCWSSVCVFHSLRFYVNYYIPFVVIVKIGQLTLPELCPLIILTNSNFAILNCVIDKNELVYFV